MEQRCTINDLKGDVFSVSCEIHGSHSKKESDAEWAARLQKKINAHQNLFRKRFCE